MQKTILNDPFGEAVTDYYNSKIGFRKRIIIHSSISGKETISVPYLFRSIKKMPEIEKTAIMACKGKTLDIGACAGSHSLVLQEQGINTSSLEISSLCCDIMVKRGVKDVICEDIYNYSKEKYDTLLLLMNGIGIAGTIKGLEQLLKHCRKLLKANGQILFDSSDIDYAYYEKDGSKWLDLNNEYYGQVRYTMQYKKTIGLPFNWLFIDKEKMNEIARKLDFNFTVLAEGDHYNYLGLLKPKT